MNKRQILENEYSRAFDGVELLKKHAPLIGISGNFRDGDCTLAAGYYRSLVEAGATPVIIPPYSDIELLVSLVKKLDGVVLSGGADIDPDYLEELPIDGIDINPERDKPELILIKLLIDSRLNKFLKESCLLSQEYIWDKNLTVASYLQSIDKELTITDFKRFTLRSE